MAEEEVLSEDEIRLEKELAELEYNSPIAKKKRELIAAKAKRKDEEIKKLKKKLSKADKEVVKANKNHEAVVKDAQRIKAEYIGHDKKLLHAKAEVQRTVTQQMVIQTQLRKLEKEAEPKEKTLEEHYRKGTSSLWGKSKEKGKVSKIKGRKDPFAVSEEVE